MTQDHKELIDRLEEASQNPGSDTYKAAKALAQQAEELRLLKIHNGVAEEITAGWMEEGPKLRNRAEQAEARCAELEKALERAEQKLSAYVGLCTGDTELVKTVLPMVRAALAEGKEKL